METCDPRPRHADQVPVREPEKPLTIIWQSTGRLLGTLFDRRERMPGGLDLRLTDSTGVGLLVKEEESRGAACVCVTEAPATSIILRL